MDRYSSHGNLLLLIKYKRSGYSLQHTHGRTYRRLHIEELRKTGELQSDDIVPGPSENTRVGRGTWTRAKKNCSRTRDRNYSQSKKCIFFFFHHFHRPNFYDILFLSGQCDKRGLPDFVQVGGGDSLGQLSVVDSICGTNSEPGRE